MDHYWTPFADLLMKDDADLTALERDCVDYYIAWRIDLEGGGPWSAARTWCRMARQIGVAARVLGRLPIPGDPGVSRSHLQWVARQSRETLNPFQRARVEAIPYWMYPA